MEYRQSRGLLYSPLNLVDSFISPGLFITIKNIVTIMIVIRNKEIAIIQRNIFSTLSNIYDGDFCEK